MSKKIGDKEKQARALRAAKVAKATPKKSAPKPAKGAKAKPKAPKVAQLHPATEEGIAKAQAKAKERAEARKANAAHKAPSKALLAMPEGDPASIIATLPATPQAPAKAKKAKAKAEGPKVRERAPVELPKAEVSKNPAPREGTAARKMFDLASRPEGASVAEINKATGGTDGSWTNTMRMLAARFGRKLDAGGERGNVRYWLS